MRLVSMDESFGFFSNIFLIQGFYPDIIKPVPLKKKVE